MNIKLNILLVIFVAVLSHSFDENISYIPESSCNCSPRRNMKCACESEFMQESITNSSEKVNHSKTSTFNVAFNRTFASNYVSISAENMVYREVERHQNMSSNTHVSNPINISLSQYYLCNEITVVQEEIDQSVHITCPCKDELEKTCCYSGHTIFIPGDSHTNTWDCLPVENDLRNYEFSNLVLYALPPIVLLCDEVKQDEMHNKNLKSNSCEYVILQGSRPYINSTNGELGTEDVLFIAMFHCTRSGYKYINSTSYQEVVCRNVQEEISRLRTPWFAAYYRGMTILCLVLYILTLLVFIFVPEVQTMKSKIIISQTVSLLVLNIMNLYYYNSQGHLPKTECIFTAYMTHFWNLVGSFWINVLCIDMAWTFSGIHLQRSERWKFIIYSIYAWGSSTFITILTALLDFLENVPENIILPNISLYTCWFSDFKSLLAYDYGPVLFLTLANGPLVVFSVYKITRALCSTSILTNNGSNCHAGSKPKRNKKRFLIYVNLALLFGTPRLLSFVRLLVQDEAITLSVNIISMLRSVFIFLFVCCRPKVYRILRRQASVWTSKITSSFRPRSQQSTQELTTNKNVCVSIGNCTNSTAA